MRTRNILLLIVFFSVIGIIKGVYGKHRLSYAGEHGRTGHRNIHNTGVDEDNGFNLGDNTYEDEDRRLEDESYEDEDASWENEDDELEHEDHELKDDDEHEELENENYDDGLQDGEHWKDTDAVTDREDEYHGSQDGVIVSGKEAQNSSKYSKLLNLLTAVGKSLTSLQKKQNKIRNSDGDDHFNDLHDEATIPLNKNNTDPIVSIKFTHKVKEVRKPDETDLENSDYNEDQNLRNGNDFDEVTEPESQDDEYSEGAEGQDDAISEGVKGQDDEYSEGAEGQDYEYSKGAEGQDYEYSEGVEGQDDEYSKGAEGQDYEYSEGQDNAYSESGMKNNELLHHIENVDNDVQRMQTRMENSLGEMRNQLEDILEMKQTQHQDEGSTTYLINATMDAALHAIKQVCVRPLAAKLSVPRWSSWNPWGPCTITCGGGGYRLRHRNCQSGSIRRCLGNDFDIAPCGGHTCPAFWLTWGHWSHCSATCDNGLRVRTRTCMTSEISLHCLGSTAEVKNCFHTHCKSVVQKEQPHLIATEHHPTTEPPFLAKPSFSDYRSKNDGLLPHDAVLLDGHSKHEQSKPTKQNVDYDPWSHYFPEKKEKPTHKKEKMLSVEHMFNRTSLSTSVLVSWSMWTGWTKCEKCGEGNRQRRRVCINNTANAPSIPPQCPGLDMEQVPCTGSACPLEQEFPHAPHVSQRQSAELKCEIPMGESPQRVYWITPTSQHVSHVSHSKRIHMYGMSLLVDKARFADQGRYRCVILFPGNVHHIHEAPLIVDTCRDHPCQHNGLCLTSADPEYDNISHYRCKCSGTYTGSFCEKGSLGPNKYVGPVIISIVSVLFGLALVIFLVRRARYKANLDKAEENQWKQRGSLRHDKSDKSADKSDVTNTSVVSNDDSFVEVTADDLEYDEFSLPRDSPSGGFGRHTSEGFEGSYLKYPSPRGPQNDESGYVQMFSKADDAKRIQFDDKDDENVIYESMQSEPLYENPRSVEDERVARQKEGVNRNSPIDAPLDVIAEQLAEHCLHEIENETLRARQQPLYENIPYNESVKRKHEYDSSPHYENLPYRSPSPQRGQQAGYTAPSSSHGSQPDYAPNNSLSRPYNCPITFNVKDKQQEAEFLKHFNRDLVPEKSPNTSTPKKPEIMNRIITPVDIINTATGDQYPTPDSVKRNLTQELMSMRQSLDSQHAHGNQSNNGFSHREPYYESCVASSESHLDSPSMIIDANFKQESFVSANSSIRTLPDIDVSVTVHRRAPAQASPYYTISAESDQAYWRDSNQQGYPKREESLYLSDYHYTPDASVTRVSQSSFHQYHDVAGEQLQEEDEDEEEEEEQGEEDSDDEESSEGSDQRDFALRYSPKSNTSPNTANGNS